MDSPDDVPVPRTAPPEEVLRGALERLEDGYRVVLATVIRRRGSTPSTPGQKLVLLDRGEALGSVGGGAIELRVLRTMQEALAGGRRRTLGEPWVEQYELGASMGMCCGGAVEVMFEVMDPALRVLVVGGGHIGTALTPLLVGIGFRVVMCDHRDGVADAGRIHEGPRVTLLHAEHDDPDVADALGPAAARARAATLVMTHDHQLDQAVIEWALAEGFGFVGGVGSRAKAARMRARLEAKGVSPARIDAVEMPLGVDIGARSPAEIAVSIAGTVIRWRAQLLGTSRHLPARDAQAEALAAVAEE
jgi:xanthine dehydrogenase accessory factor